MDRPWNGFGGKNQSRSVYGHQMNGVSPIGMPVGAGVGAGGGGWSNGSHNSPIAPRAQVPQLAVGINSRGAASVPQYVPGGAIPDSPGPVYGKVMIASSANDAAAGNADGILSSPHPDKTRPAYTINGHGNGNGNGNGNGHDSTAMIQRTVNSGTHGPLNMDSAVIRSPVRSVQGHPSPLPPPPPSPSSSPGPALPSPATPSGLAIGSGPEAGNLKLRQQSEGGAHPQSLPWLKSLPLPPSHLPPVGGISSGLGGSSSERGIYQLPSISYANGDANGGGRERDFLLGSPVASSPRDPSKGKENSIRRLGLREDKGRGKFGVPATSFSPAATPRLKVMLMADGTRHVSMEEGMVSDHAVESGCGRTSFSGRGGGVVSKHIAGGSNKSGFGGTSRRTLPSDHNSATARIWYYKDTANVEHGPQTMQELVQWHKEGYFDSSLLVREKGHNVWKTLTEICAERAPKSPQGLGCVGESLARASAVGPETHVSVLGLPASMKQLSINPVAHSPALGGSARGRGHGRSLSAEHDLRGPHNGLYIRHSPDPIVLRKSQSAHFTRGVASDSGSGVFFQSGSDIQRSPSEPRGIDTGGLISVDPDKQSDYAEKLFKATEEWFYIDPTGSLQGPFNGERMYKWWKRGFFTDTKFRRGNEGQFYTLPELIACLSMDVHEGLGAVDDGGSGSLGMEREEDTGPRFGRDCDHSQGLERIPEKVEVEGTGSEGLSVDEEVGGGGGGSAVDASGAVSCSAEAGEMSNDGNGVGDGSSASMSKAPYVQFDNERGAGSVEATVAVNAMCNEAGESVTMP